MKEIHIALVGGQAMPIFLGIKFENPDTVILVHSSDTKELAERIEVEFPEKTFELKSLNPIDLKETEELAQNLFKLYENEEVSLNISGGTKPWAYYFSKVFEKHQHIEPIYIDQNCNVWDLNTKESHPIDFDIDAQFRLNNNPLINYTNFADYTEQDFNAIRSIENLRYYNHKDFNSLLTIFPADKRKYWTHVVKNEKAGKFELPTGSFVEFTKDNDICISLNYKGRIKAKEIKSPHAVQIAFNTNWFELKIAQILSHWERTQSIYHNCHFKFNNNKDKNEVDLIVNTGSKPLFVECKTQIAATTDIDKFRTVVNNYGGMGSKALFIIDGTFDEMARKKCEESNIIPFSLSNANLNMGIENALFLFLDSELFHINTK